MRPMRPSRHRRIRCVSLLSLLLVGGFRHGAAQAMDLPMETQIPIFLKLLTFDRNLATRAGTELVIAIAYQGGNRESLTARLQADAELRKAPELLSGLTTRVVLIDLERERNLGQRLEQERVVAMYIGPLRATDVRSLLKISRVAHVRTFSGVSRYVAQGVAMGVTRRGDLPQILVNLAAAREEGADYPAQVLRLARMVE